MPPEAAEVPAVGCAGPVQEGELRLPELVQAPESELADQGIEGAPAGGVAMGDEWSRGQRGSALLRDQEAYELESVDRDRHKGPRGSEPRRHPFEGRLAVGPDRAKGLFEEIRDRRQEGRLGRPDPHNPQPRLTHAPPWRPWNRAPAAPSDT